MTALILEWGYGAAALWLGLYLINRDPRNLQLLWAGLGLCAYAGAMACALLAIAAPTAPLGRAQWLLQLLPALCWAEVIARFAPPAGRYRWAILAWRRALAPGLAGSAALVALTAGAPGTHTWAAIALTRRVISYGVLAVLAGAAALAWRERASIQPTRARTALLAGLLFFGIGTGLLLVPSAWFSNLAVLMMVGIDLAILGASLAFFDAFEQGETLLADLWRSLLAAVLGLAVFVGPVALVIGLNTGPTLPMLALLAAITALAIAAQAFEARIRLALDRLAFAGAPEVARTRQDLQAAAEAAPRVDPALDRAIPDEAEFVRFTRRALSHFGDLPRLATSPLTHLPAISERLRSRRGPEDLRDDPLERAAELKQILRESILRLKPVGDFGTSDEWRYFNAVYFPYIVGLKPYSVRAIQEPDDPAARRALEWFRSTVPERTLHNWQGVAARLIAEDLRRRCGNPAGLIGQPGETGSVWQSFS